MDNLLFDPATVFVQEEENSKQTEVPDISNLKVQHFSEENECHSSPVNLDIKTCVEETKAKKAWTPEETERLQLFIFFLIFNAIR